MKKYNLKERVRSGGETVLGAEDLGTHACYLIYGKIIKGEAPVTLKPGAGHEEIICVVSGMVNLEFEGGSLEVGEGEAIYLVGEESCRASALTDIAVYVLSGGHSH